MAPRNQRIKRGFKGFIEGNITIGTWLKESIETSHGFRFNPWLYLGGGIGVTSFNGR